MELSGIVPDFVVLYHKELKRGPISCKQNEQGEKQKAIRWLIQNGLAEIIFANQNLFKVKARY